MTDRKDGTDSELPADSPQVYALRRDDAGWTLTRRAFVAATSALPAATGTVDWTKASEDAATEPADSGESSTARRCENAFAHRENVCALAITPDGRRLVSCSSDKTIKLWSLPEGSLEKKLAGHDGVVNSVAVGSSGKVLVSGGTDRRIRLWSLPEGTEVRSIEVDNSPLIVAISSDRRSLASGNWSGLQLWSVENSEFTAIPVAASVAVLTLAMSPDNRTLATGGSGDKIHLWSLSDGTIIRTLTGHDAPVTTLVFGPDGKTLISGSRDWTLRLWDMTDGSVKKVFQGHTAYLESAAISPDGELLISGSRDGTIRLWSVREAKLIKKFGENLGRTYALAVSPDGRLLASGGDDKRIGLWSLPDGTLKTCLMDLAASPTTAKGIRYEAKTSEGRTVTMTLPCGSPIPPGAVCVCNCVPGTMTAPSRPPVGTLPSPQWTPPSVPQTIPVPGSCTCVPVHYWYPN